MTLARLSPWAGAVPIDRVPCGGGQFDRYAAGSRQTAGFFGSLRYPMAKRLASACMTPIRIQALEAAINRARSHEPATGSEASLSSDVDLMAAIYGELIYRGHTVFDADSLEPACREALMRWWEPGIAPDQAGG